MKQKYWMAVVLASLCLGSLFVLTQTYSAGVSEYNPWADINDDGWVNAKDAIALGNAFSSSGTPLEKASITFDSGWIDITDKQGQNITITHGLNSNDVMVDITGKTTVDGGQHQRQLGTADYYYAAGWNKTNGGTDYDYAYALVQTTDGGYALTGYTSSYGAGSYDFWLVKTNASGYQQWNKTYGGTDYDWAWALVQTADGGFAMAGYTGSYGAGGTDFWLVKTNASGNVQWNRTYGGTSSDWALALVQTTDGGYALAGTTYSFGPGYYDFWLVKTDSAGNALWNMTYGGTGRDLPSALVQTTEGGYAVVGSTESFGAGSLDFWLVKTDSEGNALWNMTYGGTGWDEAYALVQTADGGYTIAGRTDSFGAGGYDLWLVKTDSEGNALWNVTYGGTSADAAHAIMQTTDGGYALAGYTDSFGAGSSDFWLVKTDSEGNALWNMTYGGTNGDYAYALVQTGDGGYALAGTTYSYGAGGSDFWLVKTDFEVGSAYGFSWINSTANTIVLYRGSADPYWNYVRVRIWQPKQTP